MTTFDEVMGEEWDNPLALNEPRDAFVAGTHGISIAVPDDPGPDRWANDKIRAAVAVLGKRALALVLKHEWSSIELVGGAVEFCSACGSAKRLGHRDGCDVGALCDEVRKMRDDIGRRGR